LLVVVIVAATIRFAAADSLAVRVVREGMTLPVADEAKVAALLMTLVEGSSVNSTMHVQPQSQWAAAMAAPSLVHVRLGHARKLQVMNLANQDWQRTLVNEILLVVARDAWPKHVLLRTDTGFMAVTKYPSCTLAQLMAESGLATLDAERRRYGAVDLLCGQPSGRL
jgi:hypothetical protein